jgi:hypothetical protein
MVYFSSREMESAIASSSLSSKSIIICLFIVSFLYCPYLIADIFKPKIFFKPTEDYFLLHFISFLFYVLLTLWSIIKCNNINIKIDNKNIIERYFLLLIPITFKLIIYSCLLTIVSIIIMAINLPRNWISNHPLSFQIWTNVFMYIFGIVFVLMIINSFNNLKKKFGNTINNG